MRRGFAIAAAALSVVGCFASLDGFSTGSASPDAGSAPAGDGGVDVRELEGGAAEAGAAESSGPSCGGRGVGAPMVHVVDASFCIDTTEVTYAQYAEFFQAKPAPDAVCSFKTSYTTPPFLAGNAAIGDVDWCDAHEYCRWAGKRLCGGMNGAVLDLQNSLTVTSEWQYACTHGGSSDWPYPYGKAANPAICLYEDSVNSSTSRDVASNPQCQGPDGVFDLSGNVWEWEDACDRSDGLKSMDTDCNLRGGGFLRASSAWGSCAAVPGGWTRSSHVSDTGIRCCSDYK